MRYFIVHLVPRDLCVKYKVSTAAYNFCECLIKANIFDQTYSILPTNVPKYSEKIKWDGIEIVKSSLRFSNKFLMLLACLWEQIIVFKRIEKNSHVWLYNISILSFLLYICLRLFKPSVKIYTIVLDFTPEERLNKLLLPLINRSNGLIKLADSELFTVKNSICLAGVVNQTNKTQLQSPPFSKNFLVGGNIKEQIVMISMLLKVFSKLPNFTLHITGQAQNPDLITSYANRYPNIKFYGLAPYEEYLNILNKCPFLLSTRDPKEPRNLCNFPSKIMEGLNNNKIIISTIHYNQLDGIEYIVVPSDEVGFMNAIEDICNLSDEDLLKYANQSDKVRNYFSTENWLKCISIIESNN